MANAQPLIVAVSRITAELLPEKTARINQALKSTGLELKFVTFPSKRALVNVSNGSAAIVPYRNVTAVVNFPDLIQIKHPVDRLDLWLAATKQSNCQVNLNDLHQHSVVGTSGTGIFEALYPRFKQHYVTHQPDSAIKMLNMGRAQYTIITKLFAENAMRRTGIKIYICGETPIYSSWTYSYIHKNYAWAIPKIEQAYEAAFGEGVEDDLHSNKTDSLNPQGQSPRIIK